MRTQNPTRATVPNRPSQRTHRSSRFLTSLAALAALAAPAWGAGNLVPQTVTLDPSVLQIGNCNKIGVQVRNSGDQLINTITKVAVIVFPTATPTQGRVEKAVFVSALNAGATSPLQWVSGIELQGGGQHTVQVLVDANQQVPEANENDNLQTQFVNVSASCGGGQCDLKAIFSFPTYSNLPGSQPAKFTVAMSNIGGASCPAKTVTLDRFNGSSAGGAGTEVATAELAALAPNATKSIYLTDESHAATGTFTYKVDYTAAQSDANNTNHNPTKTVTFTVPTGGTSPQPGCDLAAAFQPSPPSTVGAGGTQSFGILFSNVGSAGCPATKAKLMRYTGSSCSGYGSQVGGSGAWQSVGELAPGQNTNASFVERSTPKGSYCYKLEYSGPFNDQNNTNHALKHTITYQ
jgi:hypothetical protein